VTEDILNINVLPEKTKFGKVTPGRGVFLEGQPHPTVMERGPRVPKIFGTLPTPIQFDLEQPNLVP